MKIYKAGHFVEHSGAGLQGSYVAWLVSHSNAELLSQWMKFVGIKDPVPPEELHCTVMYSPKKSLDESAYGDYPMQMPYQASINNGRRTSAFGKGDGAIVTEFVGRPVEQRHEFYRDYHGLEHSFDTFKPHITLSYNAAAQTADVLRRLAENPCQLPFIFDRERITRAE